MCVLETETEAKMFYNIRNYRNDQLNEEIESIRGQIDTLTKEINEERDCKAQNSRKFEHMYVHMYVTVHAYVHTYLTSMYKIMYNKMHIMYMHNKILCIAT